MALSLGTNCGFVSSAPSADPSDNDTNISTNIWAHKDTSPATATKVTELGAYIDNATAAANMEIGIYTHDTVNNTPETLLGSVSFAKGTTSGWKTQACNITISPNTVYWLAVQCDESTGCNTNYGSGTKADGQYYETTLLSDWGVSETENAGLSIAVYAVWTVGAAGAALVQLNIGDGLNQFFTVASWLLFPVFIFTTIEIIKHIG